MYEDGEFEPMASPNTEADAIVNIRIREMYDALKDEDERCRDIFSLMIKKTSQRDIATKLGIAYGTVTYYIKKIRKILDKFR